MTWPPDERKPREEALDIIRMLLEQSKLEMLKDKVDEAIAGTKKILSYLDRL